MVCDQASRCVCAAAMIVMSTTSSHVAPPKVTIASRPKTAAAAATGGVTVHTSGSEVPVPILPTTPPQQPFENGRRNNPSKKLPTPVLASTHVNSGLFATPTPPPSVRPKSSSVGATTVIRRSVPATPAQFVIASPRSGASLSAGRAHESSFERASATPALSSSSADTTGNIYHAMAARKGAEDTATQLTRRIAHFRAQEERVLREVQDVKSKLESALLAAHQQQTSVPAQHQGGGGLWPTIGSPQRCSLQSWTENSGGGCASNTQSRREPKAPRSREQLQFLTVSSACAFLCGGRYTTVQLVRTNPDSLSVCLMARAEAEESAPDAETRVC